MICRPCRRQEHGNCENTHHTDPKPNPDDNAVGSDVFEGIAEPEHSGTGTWCDCAHFPPGSAGDIAIERSENAT